MDGNFNKGGTQKLSPGQKAVEGFSAQRKSTSVDQVTWVIHEGSFLFIIYHNCQKSSPIRESCPGTHTGFRIFLSHGEFASAVYSSLFC
jgi:hypothetical protein